MLGNWKGTVSTHNLLFLSQTFIPQESILYFNWLGDNSRVRNDFSFMGLSLHSNSTQLPTWTTWMTSSLAHRTIVRVVHCFQKIEYVEESRSAAMGCRPRYVLSSACKCGCRIRTRATLNISVPAVVARLLFHPLDIAPEVFEMQELNSWRSVSHVF